MITHYIYHIPGKKVGCTKNLDNRKWAYKYNWGYKPEIEMLEELYDKTDQEAGDIEWQWADRLGYNRGAHYTVTTSSIYLSMSIERRREIGRKGGLRTGKLGLSGFKTMAPEKRLEGASRRGVCPHCGLESTLGTLHRWHFNNCLYRKVRFVRGN